MLTASHSNTGLVQDAKTASVLSVLLYYDLFRYPLTVDEILEFSQIPELRVSEIQSCLDYLCRQNIVFCFDEYYLLKNDPALVVRRKKGNAMAKKMREVAARRSEMIGSFPFVRTVCVSGSLSKNYFDHTTDIDFFIITEPGRLWICRSLLILYKKIFLLNSKKHFCVNYFIDCENLKIPDQNIFTATEIVTLIPFYDTGWYEKFREANHWVVKNFPNHNHEKKLFVIHRSGWIKRLAEWLLSNRFGESLDIYFFRMTSRHWRKKFPELNDEEFELNMRSRKDVSKHHPQGFQFRVLKHFEENCRAFEEKHQIPLH